MRRPLLVTATPPTPNGDLHLGHVSGPYLGADALRRQARMAGRDVVFVTGSDDHQSYLVRKAELRGEDPATTAVHYGRLILESLAMADIVPDAFGQPVASPSYAGVVAEFFTGLVERGHVRPADLPSLWCSSCARHLVDYDAQGDCGYCGEPCDVGICEECGRPSSPLTLRAPRCTRCGTVPELRTARKLAIDLESFAGPLGEYHSVVRSRPRTRALWEAMAADGLPVAAVAHPGDWGVPVGVPGFEGHRWWGMAEMGIGYVAAAGERWCDDAEIVQFFGYDNSYWQAILHPALFLADGRHRPADHAVVNEFYRYDGRKFSSSKDHAVWARDLLAAVPSDHVRYYLCRTAPEQEQTNFTLEEFAATVNTELAVEIEGGLRRLERHIATGTPGRASVLGLARERVEEITRALSPATFSLGRAAGAWRQLVLDLDAAAVGADPEDLAAALSLVASSAYPLLPRFAARLWDRLGIRTDLATHPWAHPAPVGPVAGGEAAPWFPPVAP